MPLTTSLMNPVKGASLSAIAALLLGCATPYQPPTSGPISSLEIRNRSQHHVLVDTFVDGETCSGRRSVKTGFKTETSSLDNILLPEKSFSIQIAANAPFSLELWGTRAGRPGYFERCLIKSTLTPRPGAAYGAEYVWEGDYCRVAWLEKEPEAKTWSPVPEDRARMRTGTHPKSNTGAWCK